MKKLKKVFAFLFITLFFVILFGSVNAQCDAIINDGNITIYKYVKTTFTSGLCFVLIIYFCMLFFWILNHCFNILLKD